MKKIKALLFLVTTMLFIQQSNALDSKLPNVLLIHFKTDYWGGIEVHTLNRYKMLVKHGYKANILVVKDSKMAHELEKLNLPYRVFSKDDLHSDLYNAITELKIDVVISPTPKYLPYIKKIAEQCNVKSIYVRHMPISTTYHLRPERLRGVDGVIGVSPEITDQVKQIIKKHNLSVKHVVYIPPFFDEDTCLSFDSHETREDFFKRRFNITITKDPVICMIANMYRDAGHKNHALLLKAIHCLVHKKNKAVHAMLAGDGVLRSDLEKLACRLNIQDYIHFLGFIPDKQALFFHSDMHVLTSSSEAFGQVHVEAALMKKPTIGATHTGATAIIENGITGLLFENNNLDDLVKQIEYLIDNAALRQDMGNAGYEHALKNFSNEGQFQKIQHLMQAVMNT